MSKSDWKPVYVTTKWPNNHHQSSAIKERDYRRKRIRPPTGELRPEVNIIKGVLTKEAATMVYRVQYFDDCHNEWRESYANNNNMGFEEAQAVAMLISADFPIFVYRIVNITAAIVCPGVYLDGEFSQNESEYQEVKHV